MTREESKAKTFDVLHFVADNAGLSISEAIEKAYNMGVSEQETNIKSLGEELRICQNSITDEKVLIGFNMAVALCNKHWGESEE